MPHQPPPAPSVRLSAKHGRPADPWPTVLAVSSRNPGLGSAGRNANLPSAGAEPGGERLWARWTARPLLRRKG